MTEISIEALLANGFKVELENKTDNNLWLKKEIENKKEYGYNWYILYEIFKGELHSFYIGADGGRDESGEFCLKHFKYIEQIDNLIDAMEGNSL
jgi:hypothetical protein